jgi:YXWGXW repeat-containing protein
MKKLVIYTMVLTLIFSLAGASESLARQNPHHRHRHVVAVRPVRPHGNINQRVHTRAGYIWVEGRWQWHKRRRTYVWVNGHTVKKKPGKVWVKGHWQAVRGGWYYVPGFWA